MVTPLLHPCTAVHAESIPDQDHRSAQVAQQVLQVQDRFDIADIVVVPLVVQADAEPRRADRETGDDRDAIVPLGMTQTRRLTARRPGASHRGRKHE